MDKHNKRSGKCWGGGKGPRWSNFKPLTDEADRQTKPEPNDSQPPDKSGKSATYEPPPKKDRP